MKFVPVSIATVALCAVPSAHAIGLISLVDLGVGQSLNQFDSATPGISTAAPITGLGVGETLLGIDFRPATGQLFGLGSGNRLYTVNTVTGAASLVGTGFSSLSLTASSYGFDFNPVIDRIRIVGTDDSNSVANPNSGDANVATTTAVFYGPGDINSLANPNLVHHAYTNSAFGPAAGSTQLYGIDSALDILVTQANNAGTLGTVGSLGIDVGELGGFDIAGDGIAYAALQVGGVSNLYTINLTTGAATSLGALTGNVSGLAAVPEPSAAVMLGLGTLALLRRRRR